MQFIIFLKDPKSTFDDLFLPKQFIFGPLCALYLFSPFYSKFKIAYIIHNKHKCSNLFALKLKTFFEESTNLAYFFYAYVVQRLMLHIILSFCKKEMETIKKCAWNPGFATAHASSICLYFTIHLCKLLLKIFLNK